MTIDPINIPDNTIFKSGIFTYKKVTNSGKGKNQIAWLLCLETDKRVGMPSCKIEILKGGKAP